MTVFSCWVKYPHELKKHLKQRRIKYLYISIGLGENSVLCKLGGAYQQNSCQFFLFFKCFKSGVPAFGTKWANQYCANFLISFTHGGSIRKRRYCLNDIQIISFFLELSKTFSKTEFKKALKIYLNQYLDFTIIRTCRTYQFGSRESILELF